MRINFYLKDKYSESETNIILYFRYNNKRLRHYTGIKIKPNQWNETKQYIYGSGQKNSLQNKKIKEYRHKLELEYDKQISLGNIPTTEYFKDFLDRNFKAKEPQHKEEKKQTFYDHYNELMQHKNKYYSHDSTKRYKGLLIHLKEIELINGITININTFDKKFYNVFVDYFIDLGQKNNTIKGKHLKTINSVLNWFVEQGYITRNQFKGIKFPYKTNPADTISLTEDEVNKLYNLDLSQNERLRKVRDVFCLECYTGLRYSDTKRVSAQSRNDKYLNIITKKTTDSLKIPLRNEAMAILDRYFNNNLPLPVISDQKMNNYLKELGELIELNAPVTILKISGKEKTELTKKKYQLLTTHTGRRTFVTLSYQRGMKPLDIMHITGHKDYETFIKYYRFETIDVNNKFFESWEQLQSKNSTIEIIKNLMIKNVSIETISFAFDIDIKRINKSIS